LQLVKEAKLTRTAMSLRRTMVVEYVAPQAKGKKTPVMPASRIKEIE